MPARKKTSKRTLKATTGKVVAKRSGASKLADRKSEVTFTTRTSKAVKKDVLVSVRFGTVVIRGQKPDPTVRSQNVKVGAGAFTRAVGSMARAGVTIDLGADVPVFRAAPEDPSVLIRRLNGKEQRGRIRQGKFEALE